MTNIRTFIFSRHIAPPHNPDDIRLLSLNLMLHLRPVHDQLQPFLPDPLKDLIRILL